MTDSDEHPPRRLRVLNCRRCGAETGIAGAAYCDDCRPHRLSDVLLTDVDRHRLRQLEAGSGDPGGQSGES